MAETPTPRRLAAVLSADVQGYSRLMGKDEEATLRALTASREVIGKEVSRHRGRIVNTTGDAVLAEFGSVLDAVHCAVAVQGALAARNAPLPPDQRMLFRIGINLGDVLVQDDDIFGDGVNIAARMEALAEGGGICLAGSAYDQVESKFDFKFSFLGEQKVKNIAKPVRAYRIAPDRSIAQPSGPESSASQPSAPSKTTHAAEPQGIAKGPYPRLAVLPFLNTSGERAQDFVGDGITEDLITDLSRNPRISVVERNLAFTYKDRKIDYQQAGKELGVGYVLGGSVRQAGERVRLNVQLVDAQSGQSIYAERFDRELKDLFEMQDEITRVIAHELEIQLVDGAQAKDWQDQSLNPKAVHLMRQGRRWVTCTYSLTGVLQGRRMFEQAAQLDPKFARAIAAVALTYMASIVNGMDPKSPGWFDAMHASVKAALAVDKSFPLAHSAAAFHHVLLRKPREAIACAEHGAALGPDHADVIGYLGWVLVLTGHAEQGLDAFHRAQTLTPVLSIWNRIEVGIAYLLLDRQAEAIAILVATVREVPESLHARISLTAAYSAAGCTVDAQREGKEVLRILNGAPLRPLAETVFPFTDAAPRERLLAWLSAAGAN